MANPLTDKMNTSDAGVKIGLHCAQCGEKVFSNQSHECAVKTDQEKKETKDEK